MKVNESSEFWQTVRRASYEIAFTDQPWKYSTEGAGRFYWVREFFRRLGPVMTAYSHAPQPEKIDTGDRVQDAVRERGRNLELR